MKELLSKILSDNVFKIILSNTFNKKSEFRKIVAERKAKGFLISKYTDKQVFHDNIDDECFLDYLVKIFSCNYKQLNAWSNEKEHIVLASEKGKFNYKAKQYNGSNTSTETHNRAKNYILKEGSRIEPLIDMGIFTPEGKIVNSMYSKYKQINRFLEIIGDEIGNNNIKHLNIIDFGCGKSYLTFILYHYLTVIANIEVNMIGLDLKKDVINKCNDAAKKYGYNNLQFILGDINGFKAPFDVDMVISLHACDTATDYALYNAICWNAKYIFSVPCCQHELNQQMSSDNMKILSRYGIIKERFSALATDAIRGNILEYCGYKTQILEFIDMDHTPKNILIRAVKRANTAEKIQKNALSELEALKNEFDFSPTLYKLIFNHKKQYI